MKVFKKLLSVTDSVKGLEGSLSLKKDVLLDNVSELDTTTETSLCFFENIKYLPLLHGLISGLVIVPESFDGTLLPDCNLFYTKKPCLTFNKIVNHWLQAEMKVRAGDIHPSVVQGSDCIIDENVSLGPNTVLGDNIRIGKNSIVESNTVIGDRVNIGENCHIYPNTTIYADTIIHDRVVIHANCSIGSDGFGYMVDENKQQKIYHVGNVVIDDDVEIGANTCIDRSTIGSTIIGKGTKIDNLVQIGHNCKIGCNSILCAQVGLAGNTELGDYVYLGGQVGAAGHLKIENGAMVGAQSGIANNIPAKAKYLGTPAIDASLQKRVIVCMKKLPEIVKSINKNEREKADQ